MIKECILGALASCIEPMQSHDVQLKIREVTKQLKQKDGESWAIGESVERIGNLLMSLSEDERKEISSLAEHWHKTGC